MGEGETAWSTGWLKSIDPDKLELYPLQFANYRRIEKNDAVYIFDEVGCGKTVSAGLMALHYLYNRPGSVLIITTPALAGKGRNDSGFFRDWCDRLPFDSELSKRVSVINFHCRNIQNLYCGPNGENPECRRYGMIVIDEAHVFLNPDTKRYKALTSAFIQAEKAVFLTATPIKSSEKDLLAYVKAGNSLLREARQGKPLGEEWIGRLIGAHAAEAPDLICSRFDEESPVTRYFKDTVKELELEASAKPKAQRNEPQLWVFQAAQNGADYTAVKLRNLYHMLRKAGKTVEGCPELKNRFVIFTRYVEAEALLVEKFLTGGAGLPEDCQPFPKEEVKVVTGKNRKDLQEYAGKKDGPLPTVLILTYQIAEQGVNLPGYNYVVNYHISAFPSALEQRLGRVDRLNSEYPCINMCYLLPRNLWDSNTSNFFTAVETCIRDFLPRMPVKNVLLNEDVLGYWEELGNLAELKEEYARRLEKLLNADPQKALDTYRIYDESGSPEPELDDLMEFCAKQVELGNLEYDAGISAREFQPAVQALLDELKNPMRSKIDMELIRKIARQAWNKIFCMENGELLMTQDAVADCAKKIASDEKYRTFKENFDKNVKVLLLFRKCRGAFEAYFEDAFTRNDFSSVFPRPVSKEEYPFKPEKHGYGGIFTAALDAIDDQVHFNEDERKLMLSHAGELLQKLPFFRMCDVFQRCLMNRAARERFPGNENPLREALGSAYYTIYHDFYQKSRREFSYIVYLMEEALQNTGDEYPFRIDRDTEHLKLRASNWYKLAYQLIGAKNLMHCLFTDSVHVERKYLEYDPELSGRMVLNAVWASGAWKFDDGDVWTEGIVKSIQQY